MTVFSVAVALAVLVILFFLQKKRSVASNVRPTDKLDARQKQSTKFHAVSLKYANNACQAAKDIQGRRYLSSAAPRVPLAECDASACRCRFTHHEDRRNRENRRSPIGQGFGSTGGYVGDDQRDPADRRSDPAGHGSWR